MSSSGAAAADAAARLALLSGPDLVAHLGTTSRKVDWDAAARVLGDRDRRLAEAEAKAEAAHTGLAELRAEVEVLKERFLEQKRAKESRGLGNGAIAAAAPRVGRRAEVPGPQGAIVDLCSSSSDEEEEELEEGEFRLRRAGVTGVSPKRKEEPAASKGDEGRRAGVSCELKETASNGEERTPAGVSGKRKEPAAASKGDEGRRAGVLCQRKEPAASNGKEQTPAGVSCQQKESPSKGDEERTSAGMSCKRKAPASSCSPDDEDDRIPLSQIFMKKQRKAQPGANGKTNQGRGDAVNSAGLLGVDRPAISPVNRGIPEAVAERMVGRPDDPKVAAFVHGTGNGQSGKNGGLSRTMPSPPPTASTAGSSPHKNCSKPDGSEGQKRIGEKEDRPVARRENDAPVQVRTPRVTDTARRIVGSVRVGAETPMEHTTVESSLPPWKSSSALLGSCLENYELCMQAVCALHRQKKFATQPTVGGITKYDAHRAAVLAEFLLDGNLQGPMKRTAEDLKKHDSEGLDLLERVVLQCSEQLFCIYRNKDDKYFS